MSVDQAIESWPLIEQVGLPIVSPSVGGPGYNNEWLLEFMERADALNYRVDYIGFHYYPNPNVSKVHGPIKTLLTNSLINVLFG